MNEFFYFYFAFCILLHTFTQQSIQVLGVQSDLPSNVYKRATGTDVAPVLQPVMAPRNSKQVENAADSAIRDSAKMSCTI